MARARALKRLRDRDGYRETWSCWRTESRLSTCKRFGFHVKSVSYAIDQMFRLPPDKRIGIWIDNLISTMEYQFEYLKGNVWRHVGRDHRLFNWCKDQRSLLQRDPDHGSTNSEQLRREALVSIRFPIHSQTHVRTARHSNIAQENTQSSLGKNADDTNDPSEPGVRDHSHNKIRNDEGKLCPPDLAIERSSANDPGEQSVALEGALPLIRPTIVINNQLSRSIHAKNDWWFQFIAPIKFPKTCHDSSIAV